MLKKCLPSDYKPGTLLKLYYTSEFPGHWIVEVTPSSFKGIANNQGGSLPAATFTLGPYIVKAEVMKRSDLLLCMSWNKGEEFERVMKGLHSYE